MGRLLLTVVATGTLVGPAALLPDDVPAGFERAPGPVDENSFDEYAALAPDAVAHVDPASQDAAAMTAAVDIWTSAESDILLREVTLWADDEAAAAFVEQANIVGADDGLDSIESLMLGGVAFIGQEDGLWTRRQTWQQGPYAATASHFSVGPGSDDTIVQTVRAIVRAIETQTGHTATERTADDTQETTGRGIPIGTVLVWVLLIGGAIWLVMRFRRRRAGAGRPEDRGREERARHGELDEFDADAEDDEDLDVDEIIERARARSRAEREVDAIADPTEEWSPPDEW